MLIAPSRGCMAQAINMCPLHGRICDQMMLFHIRFVVTLLFEPPMDVTII